MRGWGVVCRGLRAPCAKHVLKPEGPQGPRTLDTHLSPQELYGTLGCGREPQRVCPPTPTHLTPAGRTDEEVGMLGERLCARVGEGVQSSLPGLGHARLGLGPLQLCCRPLSSLPATACPPNARTTTCPDLPRELPGPFFLLCSQPPPLLLSRPLSYPPAPSSAPPAPVALPYSLMGTRGTQEPRDCHWCRLPSPQPKVSGQPGCGATLGPLL